MSGRTPSIVLETFGRATERRSLLSVGVIRTRSLLRRVGIFTATLLCVSFTGHGEPRVTLPGETDASLTIRVFNYAGLEQGALDMALSDAAAIFQRVGVPIVWQPCKTNREDSTTPGCLPTLDPTILAMRILATPLPVQGVHGHAVYGFTFPGGETGFANTASIFWSRVQELADLKTINPSRVLAAVLAHETGHLLLGENSHFPVGIMKGVWDGADVLQISQSSLLFWQGQRKDFQLAVRKRTIFAQKHHPRVQLAAALPYW